MSARKSAKVLQNIRANLPKVEIIPLGGLGEIGSNCLAILCEDQILVIDVGVKFPDANQPGVDKIIPDFSFLGSVSEKVVGVILTHGHEDHFGALDHFLGYCPNVMIYGTKFTIALAKNRVRERYKKSRGWHFKIIAPRDIVTLGPFTVEFLGVSHSTLAAVGLAITTPAGLLVHTGDFKLDLTAHPGEELDLFKFAEQGEKGVLALLSDSTNSDIPGYSLSEKEVGAHLTPLFRNAPGRVIIACFASSLPRIREVVNAAINANRKLVFEGTTLVTNVKIAQELGYLNIPDGLQISLERALSCDFSSLVFVVTGSQGEPLAVLSRIASGTHRQISVEPGDMIIFSSRIIPGNETTVNNLINYFHYLGATVIDPRMYTVHASGHGHREELKLMLALTKPHFLIPVHGEARHLSAHASLAANQGIPSENILLLQNGDRLTLYPDKSFYYDSPIKVDKMFVEGNHLGDSNDSVVNDRRRLSELGLVIVSLVLDRVSLDILAYPKVTLLGLQYTNEEELVKETEVKALGVALQYAKEWQASQKKPSYDEHPPSQFVDRLKSAVRQVFKETLSRKPIVQAHIILLDKNKAYLTKELVSLFHL
ncbi:MAG: ribonuclease J [Deltaproteobacteria bacterium]|jgi:ribonuclease J|nr:ribonuclease J [Deltaproteobacteria bacterium]